MAYSVWEAQMNNRLLPRSPNVTLATREGTRIFPSKSPEGAMQ
jgi:hypothetical protein